MKKQFSYLLLLPLLLAACLRPSDDDMDPTTVNDELPPITMQGANTFGCLVNGEVFVNRPALFRDNISMSYSENSGVFYIDAKTSAPENQTVDQRFVSIISNFLEEGNAPLNRASYASDSLCVFSLSVQNAPTDDANYLHISRFDLDEHIISGTFAFVVMDTICKDTFRITEGRFDYDYAN